MNGVFVLFNHSFMYQSNLSTYTCIAMFHSHTSLNKFLEKILQHANVLLLIQPWYLNVKLNLLH